jgi:hypothetical protein
MKKLIPEFIHAEVVIREAHTHRTWRAALPNGKIVTAFLEEGLPPTVFANGARLLARMSVTDFSRAEIVMPQPE